MNMNYLCEFAILAKSCNFSQAAEDLNMSQSSLSKHIKAIENEIGFQLFYRTTRSISLTELGKMLLPYADQLCEIDEKMNNIVKNHQTKSRCNVRIISIPVMAQYNITGDMALFQKQNPNINLLVSECESCHIDRCLNQNDCDFAFTRKSSEDNGAFDVINLFEEYLTAVIHHSNPLSAKKQIPISDLAKESFLFLDQETLFYDQCYSLCKKAGFTPNVAYTSHRPENLVDLAAQGMGVALLTRRQAEYFRNNDVVCVDITPTVKSNICIIKMKNKKMSEAARKFWSFMQSKFIST